jgi:hypothetical protein
MVKNYRFLAHNKIMNLKGNRKEQIHIQDFWEDWFDLVLILHYRADFTLEFMYQIQEPNSRTKFISRADLWRTNYSILFHTSQSRKQNFIKCVFQFQCDKIKQYPFSFPIPIILKQTRPIEKLKQEKKSR